MTSQAQQQRWSSWLLERNRRGTRFVLSIALVLYPAFGILDYLFVPSSALPLLYSVRASVTAVTLILFAVVKRRRSSRGTRTSSPARTSSSRRPASA